jgi:hypothetical protein
VKPEGLGKFKNFTSSGIKQATLQFVKRKKYWTGLV